MYLFPPRFPVSDELREKLEGHWSVDRENTPKVATADEMEDFLRDYFKDYEGVKISRISRSDAKKMIYS